MWEGDENGEPREKMISPSTCLASSCCKDHVKKAYLGDRGYNSWRGTRAGKCKGRAVLLPMIRKVVPHGTSKEGSTRYSSLDQV